MTAIINYVTNPRTAIQFHNHLANEMIKELKAKNNIHIAHGNGRFVVGNGENQKRVVDIIRDQIESWNHTIVSVTLCSNLNSQLHKYL